MEINITKLFNERKSHLYSATKAELGEDVAKITWGNALETGIKYNFLDSCKKRTEFRKYLKALTAWPDEDIQGLNNESLNALLVQLVSAAVREDGLTSPEVDWKLHERLVEEGQVSGSIVRSDEGEIYFVAE